MTTDDTTSGGKAAASGNVLKQIYDTHYRAAVTAMADFAAAPEANQASAADLALVNGLINVQAQLAQAAALARGAEALERCAAALERAVTPAATLTEDEGRQTWAAVYGDGALGAPVRSQSTQSTQSTDPAEARP